MFVIAHRGRVRPDFGDNTLAGFADAMASGVDGIETDVRTTADGRLVLYHDRLAPDGRPVEDLAYRALATQVGAPPATLEDAIEAFPHAFWNIELKTRGTAAPLRRFLERRRPERALVSSFDHRAAATAVGRTGTQVGFLLAHAPTSIGASLPGLVIGAPADVMLIWNRDVADAAVLAEARRHDVQLGLYNVAPGDFASIHSGPKVHLAIVDDYARIDGARSRPELPRESAP